MESYKRKIRSLLSESFNGIEFGKLSKLKNEIINETSSDERSKTASARKAMSSLRDKARREWDTMRDKQGYRDFQEWFSDTYGYQYEQLRNQFAHDISESQLNELSPKTLGSYIKKATSEVGFGMYDAAINYRGKDISKNIGLQSAKKRKHGIEKATDKLVTKATSESQLNELSPKTLNNYIKKASGSLISNAHNRGVFDRLSVKGKTPKSRLSYRDEADRYDNKINKRMKGIQTATDKLTNESQLNEISQGPNGPRARAYANYITKNMSKRDLKLAKNDNVDWNDPKNIERSKKISNKIANLLDKKLAKHKSNMDNTEVSNAIDAAGFDNEYEATGDYINDRMKHQINWADNKRQFRDYD